MYKGIDTELVPVAWGQRLYLVPKLPRDGVCGLLGLLQQVNSGQEAADAGSRAVFCFVAAATPSPRTGFRTCRRSSVSTCLRRPSLANVLAVTGDTLYRQCGKATRGCSLGRSSMCSAQTAPQVVSKLNGASSELRLIPAISDMPSWTPGTVHVGDIVSSRWKPRRGVGQDPGSGPRPHHGRARRRISPRRR